MGLGFTPSYIYDHCSVSQDPINYKDAPTEGIRRVLEIVTQESIPRGGKLNTDKIGRSYLWRYLKVCSMLILSEQISFGCQRPWPRMPSSNGKEKSTH